MNLKFFEAKTEDEKATCLEIRRVVFIEEQKVPEARERRDEGNNCLHYYGCSDGTPIATMRVICEEGVAKLQRMAVLKDYRGQGVGKEMLTFALVQLKKNTDLHTAILGAQDHAVSFYERAGFQKTSDGFMDARIKHYLMEKSLA